VDLAVEAMRRGARDFVQKPWDNARLLTILRTQVALGRALSRAAARGREPAAAARGGARDDRRVARDAPVLDVIARVGPSDANVLITGENGTGKGMVARALHAASPRARSRSCS
jgi:DNA-binding NtrC family response regulator